MTTDRALTAQEWGEWRSALLARVDAVRRAVGMLEAEWMEAAPVVTPDLQAALEQDVRELVVALDHGDLSACEAGVDAMRARLVRAREAVR